MSRADLAMHPIFSPSALGGSIASTASADRGGRVRKPDSLRPSSEPFSRLRINSTRIVKHVGTSSREYQSSTRAFDGHCFVRYFAGA